jgi:thiol-disulfide isomerase/thioredoxin
MGWLRWLGVACALGLALPLFCGSARGEVVLLDFQTPWCGWCRVMAPVLEELAAEGYPIRTIDGDQRPDLVAQYRVDGYPTFVVLRDGVEVARTSGKTSKQQLAQMLTSAGAATHAPSVGPTMRGQSPDSSLAVAAASEPHPILPRRGRLSAGNRQRRGAWEPAREAARPETASTGNANERLIGASVRLHVQDGNGQSTGSGTIIDCRDGEALILTCGHMFRESKDSGLIFVDLFGAQPRQDVPAKLISYDLNSDVALVRMAADQPLMVARVAPPSRAIGVGDPAISVGCDNGGDATLRLTNIVSIDRYQHAPNLQVAFEPVQGRSGGGLFNAEGEVIGVCNAADAEEKQGLFAALAAIHAELDRARLSFVYKDDAKSPDAHEPTTALADVSVARQSSPSEATSAAVFTGPLSEEEQLLLAELENSSASEIICLVRSLDHPDAKSRVLQVNRASSAFWRQLALRSGHDSARKLTSLDTHPAAGRTPVRGHTGIGDITVKRPSKTADLKNLVWPSRPEPSLAASGG